MTKLRYQTWKKIQELLPEETSFVFNDEDYSMKLSESALKELNMPDFDTEFSQWKEPIPFNGKTIVELVEKINRVFDISYIPSVGWHQGNSHIYSETFEEAFCYWVWEL